jgi:hypothetical protein
MIFDGISKDRAAKFFETARASTILEYKQILTVSFNSSRLLYKLKSKIEVKLDVFILNSECFHDSVVVQRQAIVFVTVKSSEIKR